MPYQRTILSDVRMKRLQHCIKTIAAHGKSSLQMSQDEILLLQTLAISGSGFARRDDERREAGEWLCLPQERVPKELGRRRPIVHLHLETLVEEVLEEHRQLLPLLDLRLAIGRDQV